MLLTLAAVAAVLWRFGGFAQSLPAIVVLALASLLFRDPRRAVAAAALGVVSPVDGRIVSAAPAVDSVLDRRVQRIVIRIRPFGTYTARAPVEGKVMDLHGEAQGVHARQGGGLWVHTDEGADVVLRFRGHRFGLVPAAIVRYGSRVGQGQRCAFLRWTRCAELELPETSRLAVREGQRVTAGSDLLAELPHPETDE